MFLNSMEIEHKKAVLLRNIKCLGVSSQVGERVYDMETMVSCFDYASRDRTLYNLFQEVSDHFQFGMTMSNGICLSNIFFKNLCKAETPRDSRESKQKILKFGN